MRWIFIVGTTLAAKASANPPQQNIYSVIQRCCFAASGKLRAVHYPFHVGTVSFLTE
jgi:hypothetical protein